MRICFVCNELPPAPAGGIGPYVNTTAPARAARGHDIHVLGTCLVHGATTAFVLQRMCACPGTLPIGTAAALICHAPDMPAKPGWAGRQDV